MQGGVSQAPIAHSWLARPMRLQYAPGPLDASVATPDVLAEMLWEASVDSEAVELRDVLVSIPDAIILEVKLAWQAELGQLHYKQGRHEGARSESDANMSYHNNKVGLDSKREIPITGRVHLVLAIGNELLQRVRRGQEQTQRPSF